MDTLHQSVRNPETILTSARMAFVSEDWPTALSHWTTYQELGEKLGDVDIVGRGYMRRVSCLYHLGRTKEARELTEVALRNTDTTRPLFREAFIDALAAVCEADYLVELYESGFLCQNLSFLDQLSVCTLIRGNKIIEAQRLLSRIFGYLSSAEELQYCLFSIPKLFLDENTKAYYYRGVHEKAREHIHKQAKSTDTEIWYEICLSALFAISDVESFGRLAKEMSALNPKKAKAHLAFHDRLENPADPKLFKNKIFGIGLSKTGTSSLHSALKILGFSSSHWVNPYSRDLLSNVDIPLFDALTDITISAQFKELYEKYPDARFIYTTRSLDLWEASFSNHYWRSMNVKNFEDLKKVMSSGEPMRFGQRFIDIHNSLYLKFDSLHEAYLAHDESVRKFFANKPKESFVELDVSKENSFDLLASFLGVSAPQIAFPWENTKTNKQQWRSPISGELNTLVQMYDRK